MKISNLLTSVIVVALMMLLLSSCGARKHVIKTVPIREVTTTELSEVSIPADSTELRLVVECLPSGNLAARQLSGNSYSQLQLRWGLIGNELRINAMKPPDILQVPRQTITREIPVEVMTEVEVNKLTWWQKALIFIGSATLIYTTIRIVQFIIKIKR